MDQSLVFDLSVSGNKFDFSSNIDDALTAAKQELTELEENIHSIKTLKPECDKVDYLLAVSSGTLCGIIDIFLVGEPGKSPLSNITDNWFANRTKDFAKLCGWDGGKSGSSKSAISFLEQRFKVPYDQTGTSEFLHGSVTPTNHHFKSLAHNPTLLGLFFSIVDQFTNTSDFVFGGELITLQHADDNFELRGGNIPSKLFCAFVNWIGHLMSDISGASGSSGRGMGIPSPFWSWTNDVIALKKKLNISDSDFGKNISEFSSKIFTQGYDFRFQTVQVIPVLLNELLVRLFYSIRRILKYYAVTEVGQRSFSGMWIYAEPFKNTTVKRMLTVAHGTFCLLDVGDAIARGLATRNPIKIVMRLNIVGIGRFAVSLYGEVKRSFQNGNATQKLHFAQREKTIVLFYIDGLKVLASKYDDRALTQLIGDFKSSDVYKQAFEASVQLAEKRNVPAEKILKDKQDIDNYFKPKI